MRVRGTTFLLRQISRNHLITGALIMSLFALSPLDAFGSGQALDAQFPIRNYAQGGVVVEGIAYFTANEYVKDAAGKKTLKPKSFPYVVAFDTKTFRVIRTYPFQDTYDSSPLVIRNKAGRWLVIAHEFKLSRTVAMNRDTGRIEWKSPANQPGQLFFGYTYFNRDDGSKLVFAASQKGLHALSSEDGKERWHFRTNSRGGVTPCVDQAKGWVYYQHDGGLAKLDARTGKPLKKIRIPPPADCISWNTMLVNDKHGYYIVTYWYHYAKPKWNSAIRVYDQNLKLVWEKKRLPMSKKATLTYAGGKIFAGSGNGWAPHEGDKWKAVTAYRIQDGGIAWRCDLSKFQYLQIMNVPHFNGYLFAETANRRTAGRPSVILKINAGNGAIEGMHNCGANVTSCAPSILARGLMMSGALHIDRISITRIAEGSQLDWPGPFGDPQTNQMSLPPDPKARICAMRPGASTRNGKHSRPVPPPNPKAKKPEAPIDPAKAPNTTPIPAAIPAGVKKTTYLEAVVRFLDTLMRKGTDTYGKQHSPMFCSILDLKTQQMPEKPPALLPGQRPQDRAYPGGNLNQDLFTLMTMYHTSSYLRQDRFARAADDYLAFFLKHCAPSCNGLFPCGEHAFWDFKKEGIGGLPFHEDLGLIPKEILERLWKLNPTAVERHIRKLRDHIVDEKTWYWNRHATITGPKIRKPRPIARHGGFYIYHWAFLYSKKRDPQLLDWAMKTANVHWSEVHPKSGHMPYFLKKETTKHNKKVSTNSQTMSLGYTLLLANDLLEGKAIGRFDQIGRHYTRRALEAAAAGSENGKLKKFVNIDGSPAKSPPWAIRMDMNFGFWKSAYGASGGFAFVGAEKFAIKCLGVHRQLKSPAHLQAARLVWDHYQKEEIPTAKGIIPGKFAGLMALSLNLHEITGEAKYLNYARQIADVALREFFVNGLIRGATQADYYEAANGGGALAYELLRLHLRLEKSKYKLPWSYWDI